MKTIVIRCAECGAEIEKALKEHTRQIKKNPRHRFYCSLSCCGKQNVGHLRGRNLFERGSDLQRRALAASIGTNTKYSTEERPFYEVMRRINKRRNKKEVDAGVDVAYLKEIWEHQGGRCALSNIPIDFNAVDIVHKPSLDRIDSEKGYLKGNLQFLSCAINYAKSTMSDDRARELLKLVCLHFVDEGTRAG